MNMHHFITATVLFAFGFLLPQTVQAQGRKKAERATEQWRYEIECVGIGTEGTRLVKVWSYSKNPKFSVVQAKKNAIHAVIFKGYGGDQATGCPTQRPLVDDPRTEKDKAAFFDDFFADGGAYMKYVSMANDGQDIAAGDRYKIGKEYKIGVVVTIMYSQLRKYLEQEHVIKSLTDRF